MAQLSDDCFAFGGRLMTGAEALALIAERARPTAILVNRAELLTQWRERLQQFLGLTDKQIGQLGAGRRKRRGVVDLIMMQTVSHRNADPAVLEEYGQIIVDECHAVAAPATEAALLFRVLDKARALAVFEGLGSDHQAELISALRTPQVAEIIGDLDPDDRASLFDELPASVAERLMHGLDADERAMTTAVLGYPRHAIGRYMSPEVLALRPEQTVAEGQQKKP